MFIPYAVNVTGHRPKDLYYYNESKYDDIAADIWNTCLNLYGMGYRVFITGMAQGIDMIFAEIILQLKSIYPDIQLHCYIPYIEQKNVFPKYGLFSQEEYDNIIKKCDFYVILFDNPNNKYEYINGLLTRNKVMVENSSLTLAYYKGNINEKEKGGTRACIDYALKVHHPVWIRNPLHLEQETVIL